MRQAELQRSYFGGFSKFFGEFELSIFPLSSKSITIFAIISIASLKICSFMACVILSYECMTFCHTDKFFSVFFSLRLENYLSICAACQNACGGVASWGGWQRGECRRKPAPTVGLHTEKTSWSGAEAH